MKKSFTFILLVLLAFGLTGCTNSTNNNISDNAASNTDNMAISTPSSTAKQELKIETLVQGTGTGAKKGDRVTVHYSGSLTNGYQFDSSYKRNTPFTFLLGEGFVIEGWDIGLVGMKVGEKRKLTIPPNLGYGDSGSGPIPPNSTLIFEVEMLTIQ